MDDKFGEISRAMRNRGVEIYILSEVKRDIFNRFKHIINSKIQKDLLIEKYQIFIIIVSVL